MKQSSLNIKCLFLKIKNITKLKIVDLYLSMVLRISLHWESNRKVEPNKCGYLCKNQIIGQKMSKKSSFLQKNDQNCGRNWVNEAQIVIKCYKNIVSTLPIQFHLPFPFYRNQKSCFSDKLGRL